MLKVGFTCCWNFKNDFYFFKWWFSAALSLRWCWAFSSCSEQWLFSSCGAQASHRSGFSYCGAWALGPVVFTSCGTGSLVVVQTPAALCHVGSSRRDQTHVSCFGGRFFTTESLGSPCHWILVKMQRHCVCLTHPMVPKYLEMIVSWFSEPF